jgi:hypothetical protein
VNKEELAGWFDAHMWPLYKDLCATPFPTKWKQGPRGDALKKVLTLNPSEELRDRILDSISSQIIHRKELYEKAGSMQAYIEITSAQKFYCNRQCVTWINQMGWEDEIPTLTEIRTDREQIEATGKCKHQGCNSPLHGPRFDVCTHHVSFDEFGKMYGLHTELMRDAYKAHPERRAWSPQEHRCAIREMAGRIGKAK